jgi:uncharacterized protein YjeT (DUF2065 family)
MVDDLLTALALVLILEGLLPGLAPTTWLRMMRDVARLGPRGIRIAGIVCMLAGALLLQFLH